MGVCARAPGPPPRLAPPPSAALGYLDVRVADTDYSSFAVVYIYKELEGALSTMVQLYSERPDALASLAAAPLGLSAPTWGRPLPRLPPARPLRPGLPSSVTPTGSQEGGGGGTPQLFGEGRSRCEGPLGALPPSGPAA